MTDEEIVADEGKKIKVHAKAFEVEEDIEVEKGDRKKVVDPHVAKLLKREGWTGESGG